MLSFTNDKKIHIKKFEKKVLRIFAQTENISYLCNRNRESSSVGRA